MDTYRKKIRPVRRLPDETLVDRNQLVLEVEELLAVGVGENFAARDRHHFAFAFADFSAAGVGDAEVVPGEGAVEHAFFFHFERHWVGHAVLGQHANGRLEWLEGHFGGVGVMMNSSL